LQEGNKVTFNDLQKVFKDEFGITKLADIARELEVTPQVVSNWKAKNQLPYKYVKKLKKRVFKKNNQQRTNHGNQNFVNSMPNNVETVLESDNLDFLKLLRQFVFVSKKYLYYLILIPVLICGLAAYHVKFNVASKFQAYLKILPAESNANNSFASAFGSIGNGVVTADLKSGLYFPQLIKSRNMVETLLNKKFSTQKSKQEKSTLLSFILNLRNDALTNETDRKKVALASKKLNKSIKVSTNKSNSIVEVFVTTTEPKLSYDLGNEIVNSLNEILRKFEGNRLSMKKEFIESRIIEEDYNLMFLENKLKDFREKNREIKNSPALRLEEARLIREVNVKTQIFITLKQQIEMVQINSFENSNFVNIVDTSGIPVRRKSPDRIKFVALAYLFSLFTLYIVLIGKENYNLIKKYIISIV
jgi:uncharacterized protein involved in exopolysaccharide biosynthesis